MRMKRTLSLVSAGIAVLLVIVLVGGIILNGTYYGRERVRRFALDAIRGIVNGDVMVGRIDGNLLDRFDLVDVSLEQMPGFMAERSKNYLQDAKDAGLVK